ncbi:MAG: conjugal transfer protein TraI [Rhodospirillales bacterium 69-11]|nr:MAG: conjugal transfer protein TraI [Rhodospirillales bacterium 69-11]
MARDDDFEPKLGRIRSSPLERAYHKAVLRGIARAGGRPGKSKGRFNGKHSGKGSGAARVLSPRDRFAGFRTRRVIVKSLIVQLKDSLDAAREHLRYIQRDGVTREGNPGELYDANTDRADGRAFLERCDGNRHQFRFIVSADDGADYDELKSLTRRLMQQVEADLNTKLDWVAVDHYNTAHPHTHIVVRSKDDRGENLRIAREYLTQGLRERAEEIVTLDLGPRTDLEIINAMRAEAEQERFTGLDRSLLKEMDGQGIAAPPFSGGAFRQTLLAGRLQKLRRLGLAEEIEPSRWQLAPDMEARLRALGERHDIIKTMQHAMRDRKRGPQLADYAIYDPAEGRSLFGRVVARGLSEELRDHRYLIVDGTDGRCHYVDIGSLRESYPRGSIVAITSRRGEIRQADRTVAEIAAAHGGRYSVDIHLRHDQTATQTFAETHMRRLEAMRRRSDLVEREPDGTWIIAPDHLVRAARYEQMQNKLTPVVIETLSNISLERQTRRIGATWLDRELISSEPLPLRDAGFGKDARDALIRRQQWLIEQGLAEQEQDQIVYQANMLATLKRRELARAGGQLSSELGLAYVETKPGQRVEGTYRRHVDLASGRYALVERSRDFTLVPWREVLERQIGRTVSGIVRDDTISWTFGRQRRGPEIS